MLTWKCHKQKRIIKQVKLISWDDIIPEILKLKEVCFEVV